jgi:hypothetical protein
VVNRDGHETDTLEMHYRVTLDFRLLAGAITPDACRESFFFNDRGNSSGEPHLWENIERQRRLYKLLRDNRPLLEQYLLSALTHEAGDLIREGLPDAFDAKDEDEILASLYRGMAEEDVRFFDECREMNALDANTELITRAFKVVWVGAEIEEVNRRMAGDVKRAEVIEKNKIRLVKEMISSR